MEGIKRQNYKPICYLTAQLHTTDAKLIGFCPPYNWTNTQWVVNTQLDMLDKLKEKAEEKLRMVEEKPKKAQEKAKTWIE